MEANQVLTLVNYRVVSGRDFSQPTEPMITLIPAKNLLYINAVCLRCLPEMEYANFAINDEEKRLLLKPCGANGRDSVRVKSAGIKKTASKHIRCDEFMRKVILLMRWDINSRYRARGYVFANDKETVLLFDLTSALTLPPASGARHPEDRFDGISLKDSDLPLLRAFTKDTEIDIKERAANGDGSIS